MMETMRISASQLSG